MEKSDSGNVGEKQAFLNAGISKCGHSLTNASSGYSTKYVIAKNVIRKLLALIVLRKLTTEHIESRSMMLQCNNAFVLAGLTDCVTIDSCNNHKV